MEEYLDAFEVILMHQLACNFYSFGFD